ncbi:MAG: MlaD family protein [Bacillota bacterium]|jgi:phospholipid/cholesterol/gamma-HCH transport system substrate-binding protein
MGVNPETKVGILMAFTLMALFSLFFWLNRVTILQKGSRAEVVFERIEGLRPGAPVKYIGVDIGRIKKIYFEDQHIIVVVHINQGFELPHTSKAIIASSGVIGDKYLELQPLKPGERPLANHRIRGETPISMEQLYSSAFEILNSVKQTVDALNLVVADPGNSASLKNVLANLEKMSASAERLIASNETVINKLVRNIGTASAQLSQACLTVNRFLGKVADARTAAELKELLIHINKVSTNLDQFSGLLAEHGPQLVGLSEDASQTMTAITHAAQSITKAVNAFNAGATLTDGPDKPENALSQAGRAVRKASAYVNNLFKISASQQLGLAYQSTDDLAINYRTDLNLSEHRSLTFELADIGHDNLGTLQYNIHTSNYLTRFGLYRNQVGVGVDWIPHPNYSFGVDLWDTHSANLGISTKWQIHTDWSLRLSASRDLETNADRWQVGWWRRF